MSVREYCPFYFGHSLGSGYCIGTACALWVDDGEDSCCGLTYQARRQVADREKDRRERVVAAMREIKFRGMDDNGHWHFGDLSTSKHFPPQIVEGGLYTRFFFVDPDTVGQFTGFRDSEEKEIFEGDVLKYKTWAETGERYVTMGEVRFVQDQFLVVGPKNIVVQELFSVANEPELSDVLVIGNVHDNPELIEVSHEDNTAD